MCLFKQEEVEKLKSQGASEEKQREILEQHELELNRLVSRIDSDRLRQQSMIKQRIQEKKEERLRKKQKELISNAEDNQLELKLRQQNQLQMMKADEVAY